VCLLLCTDALTDASEVVTDTYTYYAFGELKTSTGTTANPCTWVAEVGYWKDTDLDRFHLGAREYEPEQARFISKDPLGVEPDADVYRYVGNSPITFIDPAGAEKLSTASGAPPISNPSRAVLLAPKSVRGPLSVDEIREIQSKFIPQTLERIQILKALLKVPNLKEAERLNYLVKLSREQDHLLYLKTLIGAKIRKPSPVASMSFGEKFAGALKLAYESGQLEDSIKEKVAEILQPENMAKAIATLTAIAAAYATAHGTPAAPFLVVADVGFAVSAGTETTLALLDIYFAVNDSIDEGDLKQASKVLSDQLAGKVADEVLGVILKGIGRGAGKVAGRGGGAKAAAETASPPNAAAKSDVDLHGIQANAGGAGPGGLPNPSGDIPILPPTARKRKRDSGEGDSGIAPNTPAVPKTGETASTAIGKDVHKKITDARRGQWRV
jgi:RHS repeat-associated protein